MAKKKEEVLETIEEATGENNTVDKFFKQDLIDNAKALGYDRYVVVGALYGVKDEKLSKQELDDLVNKFLSK
jgi:hypothetical protein|nr:MAG TPA: hypothetical protein [Caudoviricetes sp.]